MKKVLSFLLVLCFISMPSLSFAVSINNTPATQDQEKTFVPVSLQTKQYMCSKKVTKTGDEIQCTVSVDVFSSKGDLLVPKDTPATVYVKEVKRTGMTGKAGQIMLTENFTIQDKKSVNLLDDKSMKFSGHRRNWTVGLGGFGLATIIGAPLGLLLLIKGGDAKVPEGSVLSGYILE